MTRRGKLEVIYDFLKIIQDSNNSIKPTPLMRKSNLSSQRYTEYMHDLAGKGLVKEIIDKKGRKYVTLTDKGLAYLEKYKMIMGFIEEFEL